jgi:hypothetical protein
MEQTINVNLSRRIYPRPKTQLSTNFVRSLRRRQGDTMQQLYCESNMNFRSEIQDNSWPVDSSIRSTPYPRRHYTTTTRRRSIVHCYCGIFVLNCKPCHFLISSPKISFTIRCCLIIDSPRNFSEVTLIAYMLPHPPETSCTCYRVSIAFALPQTCSSGAKSRARGGGPGETTHLKRRGVKRLPQRTEYRPLLVVEVVWRRRIRRDVRETPRRAPPRCPQRPLSPPGDR